MRCPSCSKFPALTFEEPEWESEPEVSGDRITGAVRIVRNSECCGNEMKEARFDVDVQIPAEVVEAHTGEGHTLEVETPDLEQIEEGGGRYKKSYYGASCTFEVRCSCQEAPTVRDTKGRKHNQSETRKPLATVDWSDKINAGAMDELV